MSNLIRSYLYIDEDFDNQKTLEKMFSLITQEDVHLKRCVNCYEVSELAGKDFIKIAVSLNTMRHDLVVTNLSLVVFPFYDDKLLKFIEVKKNGINYLFDLLFISFDKNVECKNYFVNLFSKVPDDILDTVKTYTNLNGAVSDVSEIMFTHRNTINYRINRFIQLTSIDIRQLENIALVRWLFLKLNY